MKEGSVVIAVVPQIDEQAKKRPVIVLREMPPFQDLLVCGVTSQIFHWVPGFDEVISPSDADFRSSGLLTRSLIRLGYLSVIPRRKAAGAIGSISSDRHRRLLTTLGRHLFANLKRG